MGTPRWLNGKESTCQSLSQEDHLEKDMATHSSILAWRIPWTEEPGGLQSMELDITELLMHAHDIKWEANLTVKIAVSIPV